MVATLALFWRWVRERLLSLSLSPEQELVFLEQLLPAAYLSVAAPKASTAEGRNGHLALWHHSRHRLSPQRLQSLTVLANFFHRRPDGTTAAERFFATAPSDLFEWLLAHVALPARPASSRLAT